jgi:hypothetical protein
MYIYQKNIIEFPMVPNTFRKQPIFYLLIAISLFPIHLSSAQTITGSWEGKLDLGLQQLPLVFHFEPENGGWRGSLDSPKQQAFGIPLTNVLFDGTLLSVKIASLRADFEGTLLNNSINGQFKQSGLSLALMLSPLESGKETSQAERPQTPKGPFPYDIINTSFVQNRENLLLKGTLTKPLGEGPFPAVVLISGSGPQDRNSEIFGHYPFWVIADFLTKNGIAVLRFDDRGVGESEGTMEGATTLDFVEDAWAAVDKLKSFSFVDKNKTGVIGHSEGGLIAWMMGAQNKGNLSFLAALAPPVIPIDSLMSQQTYDIVNASGAGEALAMQQQTYNFNLYKQLKTSGNTDEARAKLKQFITEDERLIGLDSLNKAAQISKMLEQYAPLTNPWFYYFIKMEPKDYIRQITVPAWAAFAEKDKQVNAKSNKKALDKMAMPNIMTQCFDGLNHLFQAAETGAISEYSTISETFNPKVLEELAAWVKSL